ncbi:MAG: molybdopterin-dependent oxidoreductase [Vicinamibacterales bacterium]|jgi:DMSO/TMAO reductase YedYZ molybdopterin-dependent catalytic subunit|nr:oxidoreductase [Acidobacteriota bacterium]MDP7294847.1 molybdopterin-dependent oxidoreductase [Vicinamibacterales bacterium]MDP7471662.1 molybdopterin-dependent oxidoreductase [Vicinamibacterales bacterium]MDP7672010.1 molybdopterin-dependent oxidoreductase [Vicinamibacterales bacterium]HJO37226.1 molybdopterin-dependent oxidoreductase [Vicinamibacterales bacterium]
MPTEPSSLIARRQRYIDRQRALRHGVVDAEAAGPPEGSGPVNRHGMPQLPVGQHVVPNWPVLDLGVHPEVTCDTWRLNVCGLVDNPLTLTWDDFMTLPQIDDVSDFHCVTTWSRFDNRWRGVRFRDVAELVVPRSEAAFVICTGSDADPTSGTPYTTSLPLARAVEDDVLLVHTWDEQPLPREHGGPCRMITPKLYAWKGTKWIRAIEFADADRKGFWETRGYSDTAEPWRNDRFSP